MTLIEVTYQTSLIMYEMQRQNRSWEFSTEMREETNGADERAKQTEEEVGSGRSRLET
jgi:hypothetical protein